MPLYSRITGLLVISCLGSSCTSFFVAGTLPVQLSSGIAQSHGGPALFSQIPDNSEGSAQTPRQEEPPLEQQRKSAPEQQKPSRAAPARKSFLDTFFSPVSLESSSRGRRPIHLPSGWNGKLESKIESLTNMEPDEKLSFRKRLLRFIRLKEPIAHVLAFAGFSQDMNFLRGISSFLAFLVHTVLVLSVLGSIGLDIQPFVTTIGLSGFVVGFALKEVATNILSGVLLVVQRPFRVGWTIKVAGYQGRVSAIDSRYVYLTNDEGHTILLPSYKVYSSEIIVLATRGKVPPKKEHEVVAAPKS